MDVYIALRSDGAIGSGTENDPWNGGRANYPVFSVTAVTVGTITNNASFAVTVTTSVAHGFNQSGEIVLIKGIGYPDGELLNGSFWVTPVTSQPTQFTYSVYYSPLNQYPSPSAGALTISGVTCQKDPFLFDAVMRSLAPTNPVRVHLSPGVFETKGYQYFFRDSVSWKAFAGLKIRGSGIRVTTLKLVEASHRNIHYHVMGMPPLDEQANVADGFEASDCTIDCNVGGQNSTQLTCGAVSLRGSHTRLSRLRVINYGRQGPGVRKSGATQQVVTPELFVFAIGGSSWNNNSAKYQSRDCIVEDCIVEQPSFNNFRESTIMVVSGGDVPGGSILPIPSEATVFRRNYVNCEYQLNPTAIATVSPTVVGASPAKIKVTIVTQFSHGQSNTAWVRISGVRVPTVTEANGYVSNSDGYNNVYNGSFLITLVNANEFWYETDLPATGVPTVNSVIGAWVNRWPSNQVKVASVVPDAFVLGTPHKVTIKTNAPHYLIPCGAGGVLTPGCIASLDGISDVGVDPSTPGNLNVPWLVTQVISNYEFKCERNFEGVTPLAPGNMVLARIGARWQALAAGSLIESNQVISCAVGGHYIDTYGLWDSVVRGNYYSRVSKGVNLTLQNANNLTKPTVSYVSGRSTGSPPDRWFATFGMTSGLPHYLVVGQGVLLSGAKNGTTDLDLFNRSFKLLAIPSPSQFEIELDGDPNGLVPTNTPTLDRLWVSRNCSFENNTIKINPGFPNSYAAGYVGGLDSGGFVVEGTLKDSVWLGAWNLGRRRFFRHLNMVIRNNTVRYATNPDGTRMSGFSLLESFQAIQLVEQAIVSGNTVDVDWRPGYIGETPLIDKGRSDILPGQSSYAANYSSAGRFIPKTQELYNASGALVDIGQDSGTEGVVEAALTIAFL